MHTQTRVRACLCVCMFLCSWFYYIFLDACTTPGLQNTSPSYPIPSQNTTRGK